MPPSSAFSSPWLPCTPRHTPRTTCPIRCTLSRRALLPLPLLLLPLPASPEDAVQQPYLDPAVDEPEITTKLFIRFSDAVGGNVIIGLYGTVLPETVANLEKVFKEKKLVGTRIVRVTPGIAVQIGVKGEKRKLENMYVKHSLEGAVSMVVKDGMLDGTFFVSMRRGGGAGYLDGRHCAVGRVIQGWNTLLDIERKDNGGNAIIRKGPTTTILDCGVV